MIYLAWILLVITGIISFAGIYEVVSKYPFKLLSGLAYISIIVFLISITYIFYYYFGM